MIPKRHDMIVTRWQARFMGRNLPVSIGRGGITQNKQEGDMATPKGTWKIVAVGYRADRITAPKLAPNHPINIGMIGPNDIWSDDPKDPDYNQHLSTNIHPFSHEKLRLQSRLYDVLLITDWNFPNAQPNKGSAIFIHQWRKPRHPTAGCLAFAPKDLRWIMQHWTNHSRILIR